MHGLQERDGRCAPPASASPSAALSACASPRFCSGDASASSATLPSPPRAVTSSGASAGPITRQRAAELVPAAAVDRATARRRLPPTGTSGRRARVVAGSPPRRLVEHLLEPRRVAAAAGHEPPAGAHPVADRARLLGLHHVGIEHDQRLVRARRLVGDPRPQPPHRMPGAPSTDAYAASPAGEVAYDDERGPSGVGESRSITASTTRTRPGTRRARARPHPRIARISRPPARGARPHERGPALARGGDVRRPRRAAAVDDVVEGRGERVEVLRVQRAADLVGRDRGAEHDRAARVEPQQAGAEAQAQRGLEVAGGLGGVGAALERARVLVAGARRRRWRRRTRARGA